MKTDLFQSCGHKLYLYDVSRLIGFIETEGRMVVVRVGQGEWGLIVHWGWSFSVGS